MGKSLGEIGKMILSAIVGSFMMLVLLSGTVLKNKADKEYVDKQDEKIINEYRKDDEDLEKRFIREMDRMNKNLETLTETILNRKT